VKQNKLLYRILIITAFIAVNVLILFGISKVLVYLNSGADKANLFHGDVAKEVVSNAEVTWVNLVNPGRPIEIPAKEKIEMDYLEAWYVRNKALLSGEVTGIEDTYTQMAGKNLLDLVAYNLERGLVMETIDLSHQLHLDFYSADGQLVVLTDKKVKTHTQIFQEESYILDTEEISSYKVVMLLEGGHWRIRHLEKLESETPNVAKRSPHSFETNIAGINYYPQDSPWDTFGEDYSVETLESDFKTIHDLGLNTIRIFIGYEDFGEGVVHQDKLDKLSRLMDVARARDLKVIITLFDFYGDYSIGSWANTRRHASMIVDAVKAHSALLGWDVKNEPDLDFNTRSSSLVKTWLLHMTQNIQEIDPAHPVTIGWSSAEAAVHLSDYVDYVSFHHYQAMKTLPSALEGLRAKTDKELVLQEFGMSSARGFWNPFGNSENDQLEFYTAFFENQKRDSLHYLSWTLYDFTSVPNDVAGKRPWRKNKQSSFGIINTAGENKAAYQAFLLY